MAGIYFHIPFCKKACHYCDFHFSTSLKSKNNMVEALKNELLQRKNYLGISSITTIYFGGGTPSLLNKQEITALLKIVFDNYNVMPQTEITLEANPDDLTIQKIEELKSAGINRLSIGIQSFNDDFLTAMNRSHSASQAMESVKNAQSMSFDNISIDLMYGLPHLTSESWKHQIEKAIELNVPHISAYCLTVEKGTALHRFIETGKVTPLDEEQANLQFGILMDSLAENGFEHYEISNFSKPNQQSQHNTAYWKNEKYLGIGPSAHSYNGKSRQWNIAHNHKYTHGIKEGSPFFEKEMLSKKNKFNEYILTRLRTHRGINTNEITDRFDVEFEKMFAENINRFLKENKIQKTETGYRLTRKGKFFADGIAAAFFQS